MIVTFPDGYPFLLREGHDDGSRDAVQDAAVQGRGMEGFAGDEKEIADGAFGQLVFPIQEQAVEGAGRNRLTFGENIVEEVGGFNLRRQRFGQIASGFGDSQRHTIA